MTKTKAVKGWAIVDCQWNTIRDVGLILDDLRNERACCECRLVRVLISPVRKGVSFKAKIITPIKKGRK